MPRPDIEYLTARADSVRFRPCVERELRAARIRAKVTVTKQGYLAVRAATKRDRAALREATTQIERKCRI